MDPETGKPLGDSVVVKDSWVWQHREREGHILTRILESASCLNDTERARLRNALVTVEFHGDVCISGKSDCTRSTHWKDTRSFNNVRGGFDAPVVQVHYRTVYKEVCQPLRMETCLATAFASVAEICEGALLLLLA